MPGLEPCQNNFPATLAHQKKREKTCSATENQSCWPFSGKSVAIRGRLIRTQDHLQFEEVAEAIYRVAMHTSLADKIKHACFRNHMRHTQGPTQD